MRRSARSREWNRRLRLKTGGGAIRISGDARVADLVSAAKSAGYDLWRKSAYVASGHGSDADIKRLHDRLGKLPGVRQVEVNGVVGGAAVRVQGAVEDDALVSAAKSAGYTVKPVSEGGGRQAGGGGAFGGNDPEGVCNTMPALGERALEDSAKQGEIAPDLMLTAKDGKSKIRLSDYRGKKPVVLLFGSYTCPPFRARMVQVEELYQKYKDRADFLLVYLREAHPDSILFVAAEGGNKALQVVPQTSTEAERLEHLHLFTKSVGLTMPAVIESDDGAANHAYAGWPSRFYILGTDGRIAVKGAPGPTGFKPADIAAWLDANAK